MVLVQEYSLPVQILAPRVVPTAVGDVEQQPPVGVTPLLPRSLAIKAISLAVQGAWSGLPKGRRPATSHAPGGQLGHLRSRADVGTKALPEKQFVFCRDVLNGYALVRASRA